MIKGKNISERLQFLGLDEETRQILCELKPNLEAEIPGILERFYRHIETWPQVNSLFESKASKARARQRQGEHWSTLLSAKFDDAFVEAVKRVGQAHFRIGLDPQWYIASYAYIIGELFTAVSKKYATDTSCKKPEERDKALGAVLRAALLDMELAISVYLDEGELARRVHETNERLKRSQAAQAALKEEIGKRKKIEKQLKQKAAQLEAANKELEAFTYSVSHDLRAPLRSIDGFCHALTEDYEDKLDDNGQDMLQRVRKATAKMGVLIDDMLALSRLSRASFLPKQVDLSNMAREIVRNLQEANPERKVDVKIAPQINAKCDPRLMQVALTNLLDNAWKYTGQQPQARIEFGQKQINGKASYFVQDNGVGFDMAYVNKLFQPFQRLHSVKDFPGTGIGLATVARVIHRHGGQISAQSEAGKGTTFTFEI